MSELENYCKGSVPVETKYKYFEKYLTAAKFSSNNYLDKEKIKEKNILKWIFRLFYNASIGAGYCYIISLHRPINKRYLVFPLLTCVGFGYFNHLEDKYTLYNLINKYEYDTYKYYCNKKG